MIKKDIKQTDNSDKKERYIVKEIDDFIDNNRGRSGRVLVLCGLRRTGKTTAIEQSLLKHMNREPIAYYETDNNDEIDDVFKIIIEERKRGTKIICFDEITEINDFINCSAYLPDIFAKEGVKIILTGTNSLGFLLAENKALFDRTINIETTHISFAEHCRVLGVKDIDDYIKYGGLMREGLTGEKNVLDYKSACRYLDSAVANNIAHSISNDTNSKQIGMSDVELRSAIEKLVETYSGKIDINTISKLLKDVTVNYPIRKVEDKLDLTTKDELSFNRSSIISDFSKIINADIEISRPLLERNISVLEAYLLDMQVLSSTPKTMFRYSKRREAWEKVEIMHESYIIQPAIKYYHLQEAKRFIENESYYEKLPSNIKEIMEEKLEEKIMGDMVEQIVLYDVRKDLPEDKYKVYKPVFYKGRESYGEYDMLVWNKQTNKYFGFEVKHSNKPHYEQSKHLEDSFLREEIDYMYGEREGVAVLYRGNPFVSNTGIFYFNITDFMLAVDEYKDMEKVFDVLTKDLPEIDVKKLNELEEKFEESTVDEQLKIGKEINNIRKQINTNFKNMDDMELEK